MKRLVFLTILLTGVLAGQAGAQSVSTKDAGDWLSTHLPSFFIQVSTGVTTYFRAKYTPDGCVLHIEIKSTMAPNQITETDSSAQLYVVTGEPAPGKRFATMYGYGPLDFSLVDLASLRIKQEERDTDVFPLGVGWGNFSFPYEDREEAARVLKAVTYLAKKCGAQGSPF